MKNQASIPSKAKSGKIKCRLQLVLFGALRVNVIRYTFKSRSSAISCCPFILDKDQLPTVHILFFKVPTPVLEGFHRPWKQTASQIV